MCDKKHRCCFDKTIIVSEIYGNWEFLKFTEREIFVNTPEVYSFLATHTSFYYRSMYYLWVIILEIYSTKSAHCVIILINPILQMISNNNMYIIMKSLPITLLMGCVNNESNLIVIRDLLMASSHIENLYKA